MRQPSLASRPSANTRTNRPTVRQATGAASRLAGARSGPAILGTPPAFVADPGRVRLGAGMRRL